MYNLQIGVIGTGHMGRNHIRNIVGDNRFHIVGVYDKSDEAMERASRAYGVKKYDVLEQLLDDVEAVVIAAPSSLHKEISLVVAEHNVHALVEKPLALTRNDAQEIVDAFNKRNLKLAVGHIERYNPAYRELKKIVSKQEVFCIEACRYSPYGNSGRITDTSVIEDLMIHDVDLVCGLMKGKSITSIHSCGETVITDKTDFATCVMDFGGEAHAIISASRIAQDKERIITVHTRDSCIYANLLSRSLSISKSANMKLDSSKDDCFVQDGIVQRVFVPLAEPLKEELLAFYNSIANNQDIEVNGQVGVNAIRICERVANGINRKMEEAL